MRSNVTVTHRKVWLGNGKAVRCEVAHGGGEALYCKALQGRSYAVMV